MKDAMVLSCFIQKKIVKQKEKTIYKLMEAAPRGVLWKKAFLKNWQNSQENICARTPFIKKETLAEVFSRKLCELSKSAFFTEHLWTNASGRRYGIDNFVM